MTFELAASHPSRVELAALWVPGARKVPCPNKNQGFFQSEDPKRAVTVLSNTFFMMGIQDTLKINTA